MTRVLILLLLLSACADPDRTVRVYDWWPNSGLWHPLPDGVGPWPPVRI